MYGDILHLFYGPGSPPLREWGEKREFVLSSKFRIQVQHALPVILGAMDKLVYLGPIVHQVTKIVEIRFSDSPVTVFINIPFFFAFL